MNGLIKISIFRRTHSMSDVLVTPAISQQEPLTGGAQPNDPVTIIDSTHKPRVMF